MSSPAERLTTASCPLHVIREHGYFQNSICNSKAQKLVTLLLQKFNDRRFTSILFSAFDITEAVRFYDSKNRHLEF